MFSLADRHHEYIFDIVNSDVKEIKAADRSSAEIHQLPLDTLASVCRVETDNFLRKRLSDPRYGFELFRRALQGHSDLSWEAILGVYGYLVSSWVRKHPSFPMRDEDINYYVNRAFERLWRNIACKQDKFSKFNNLKSILRFLKMCVHSAVMDDAPRNAPDTIDILSFSGRGAQLDIIEPFTLSQFNKDEFWQLVMAQLNSTAEQVAIIGYFYLGMKNRELYSNYPDLFRSTKQLANIRLNVLRRLARLPQFEQRLSDFLDSGASSQRFLSC